MTADNVKILRKRERRSVDAAKRAGKVLFYAFLILLAVVFLFPYVFMINRGLMSNEWILEPKMHYFTDGFHFENYALAFSDGGYGLPLLYSILVCAITFVSVPVTSLMAGYAFARLEWIGKKFVFALMMLTALIPAIVTQVPLFVLYNSMQLTNTLLPLFLPSLFFAGAMNVFLTRQFLMSVPKELEESALLDGAGPLKRCFAICAPMCKPILIYLAINTFIATWGDYYTPSIYNTSEDAPFTLAYALYFMTSRETNSLHPEWIFAAATIMSVVPAVLFGCFQRYLIEGIATVGIKG